MQARRTVSTSFITDYRSHQVMETPDTPESTDEQKEKCYDILIKSMIIFTYMCLGAYRYVPGVTLLDLSSLLQVDFAAMPLLYTSRASGCIVGYTAGPLLLGSILRSANQFLLICISTFLLAVACFYATLVSTFNRLVLVFAISGLSFAVIDISTDAALQSLVMKRNQMFNYAVHFFYAVGSISFTLVARDYVREGVTATSVLGRPNISDTRSPSWLDFHPFLPIEYTYIILSSLIFLLSVLWLATYCFGIFHSSLTCIPVEENPEVFHRRYKYVDVLNFWILNFIGGSLDFSYSQVLPLHCILHMKMVQEEAVAQTVKFLGFFCLGRLTETFVSRKVKPSSMLFLGSILTILSSVLFYLAMDMSRMYFYMGNAILGFGSAPYYPALLTWVRTKIPSIHQNFIPYVIMTSLSEMVVPVLVIKVMWSCKCVLPYFVITTSVVYLILLIIQYVLFYRPKTNSMPFHQEFSQSMLRIISSIRRLTSEGEEPETNKAQEEKREFSASQAMKELSDIKARVSEKNREVENILKKLELTTKTLSQDEQPENSSASKSEKQ